jgi:hypothetical protein
VLATKYKEHIKNQMDSILSSYFSNSGFWVIKAADVEKRDKLVKIINDMGFIGRITKGGCK